MSRRTNLLHKFDIRPNIRIYIPSYDKSYVFNFFMDIISVSIVSIYAAIILMFCIILLNLVFMFLIINAFHIMSIGLNNDYNILKAIVGIICLCIFCYLSYKTNKIKQKTVFSFIGFMLYVSLTIDLISDYFLSKLDTDLEEGIIYMIIIMCIYFFVVSIIYNIIYLYKNNKSYYFHKKTKFIIKIIYGIFYLIFTLLPMFIIYLLYFNTPAMFLLICIFTICALFLFMIAIVLVNI